MTTKLVIPLVAYQTIPAIYKLIDDLTNLNSQVVKYVEGDNLIVEFPVTAKPANQFKGDESVILSILDNGGIIENYLFGIRAPLSSANIEVPVGVPLRTNITGSKVFDFEDWFRPGADVWKNTISGKLLYYNQPNPSGSTILTGAESNIIRKIDTENYSFLTVAEVLIEVAKPNWVKL